MAVNISNSIIGLFVSRKLVLVSKMFDGRRWCYVTGQATLITHKLVCLAESEVGVADFGANQNANLTNSAISGGGAGVGCHHGVTMTASSASNCVTGVGPVVHSVPLFPSAVCGAVPDIIDLTEDKEVSNFDGISGWYLEFLIPDYRNVIPYSSKRLYTKIRLANQAELDTFERKNLPRAKIFGILSEECRILKYFEIGSIFQTYMESF